MGARSALIVLTLINFLNYMDRWLISAIMPAMSLDLKLTNTQSGLIMSSFMLGYFLTSPFFGYLADRTDRSKLVAVGTGIWSLATAAVGFGKTGLQIGLARIVVGVGEASTVSTAQALLCDFYRPSKRNQVVAVFTTAIPVGSALGFILGGYLAHRYGWRNAFFIAGLPGMLGALTAWAIKDPGRGKLDDDKLAAQTGTFRSDVAALLKNAAYMKTVLGYAAFTFTVGGFASWAPQYLVTVRHLPLTEADTMFGTITVITGTLGSLFGGWGGAYFLRKRTRGDLGFVFWLTVAATPFAFLCFVFSQPVLFFACMAITQFLLFSSQPSVNVVCMETVSPAMRGMALALAVFLIHLLGDLVSPPLVGFFADYFSLQSAIFILPSALILAFWFYGQAINRFPSR